MICVNRYELIKSVLFHFKIWIQRGPWLIHVDLFVKLIETQFPNHTQWVKSKLDLNYFCMTLYCFWSHIPEDNYIKVHTGMYLFMHIQNSIFLNGYNIECDVSPVLIRHIHHLNTHPNVFLREWKMINLTPNHKFWIWNKHKGRQHSHTWYMYIHQRPILLSKRLKRRQHLYLVDGLLEDYRDLIYV